MLSHLLLPSKKPKHDDEEDLFPLTPPARNFLLPRAAYPHQDTNDDCLSCRVLGSTAFVTLGGYTYFSGMKSLRDRRRAIELSPSRYKYGARQLGILGLSATLVGLGLYRVVN